MRTIGVIVLLLGVGAAAQPQRFEVASVRESQAQGIGSYRLSPAVRFTNIPLDSIISIAFAENQQQALTQQFRFDFSKVNAGLLATRFDIDGRGDGDPAAMLRTLLRERFGLRTRVETREGSRYTVTVTEAGEFGPWLKPSSVNCAEQLQVPLAERAPECLSTREQRRGVRVSRFAGTIDELIRREVIPRLQAPVVDGTGLTGTFVWEIAVRPVLDESDMLSALNDAFEDDLGLTIERERGPIEVIVVDAVQMPTPN